MIFIERCKNATDFSMTRMLVFLAAYQPFALLHGFTILSYRRDGVAAAHQDRGTERVASFPWHLKISGRCD
jgi:hypothetical protein